MSKKAADEQELQDLCVRAVRLAALDLGLDPERFARELAQGEIGLLVVYLRDALSDVRSERLRADAAALVHRLTAWTAAP